MFVIPRNAVAHETAELMSSREALSYPSYQNLLHNVVPLPVPPGSFVGWYGDILHWGGTNHGGTIPRVSLAIEFRSNGAELSRQERPMLDPRGLLPSFTERLFAIAKAFKSYTQFEPMVSRFRRLAEQLAEETIKGNAR
jgi:hypothetical protein